MDEEDFINDFDHTRKLRLDFLGNTEKKRDIRKVSGRKIETKGDKKRKEYYAAIGCQFEKGNQGSSLQVHESDTAESNLKDDKDESGYLDRNICKRGNCTPECVQQEYPKNIHKNERDKCNQTTADENTQTSPTKQGRFPRNYQISKKKVMPDLKSSAENSNSTSFKNATGNLANQPLTELQNIIPQPLNMNVQWVNPTIGHYALQPVHPVSSQIILAQPVVNTNPILSQPFIQIKPYCDPKSKLNRRRLQRKSRKSSNYNKENIGRQSYSMSDSFSSISSISRESYSEVKKGQLERDKIFRQTVQRINQLDSDNINRYFDGDSDLE